MMEKVLVLLVAVITVAAGDRGTVFEEIQKINNAQNCWRAGWNGMTTNDVIPLLGLKLRKNKDLPVKTHEDIDVSLPDTFDARLQWPKCDSINSIKNQGHCGSCWAVSSASVLSDRLCIKTNAKIKLNVSAENLAGCCSECVRPGSGGCDGGYLDSAYNYAASTGIVTGGDYESQEGCQPYEIPPAARMYTPPCHNNKCTNKKYKKAYKKDKHFAKNSYSVAQDVEAIKKEIYTNGPVTTGFMVFDDFRYYKSGVYTQTSSYLIGQHAVRILGWGTEDGVDYWLVANSWGRKWGDNGLFKIIRGTNECTFEENVIAGIAKK